MNNLSTFIQQNPWILLIVGWELFWKGLALWRAAQQKQRYWFVALLFINTAGLLPIAYLTFFAGQKKPVYPKHQMVGFF